MVRGVFRKELLQRSSFVKAGQTQGKPAMPALALHPRARLLGTNPAGDCFGRELFQFRTELDLQALHMRSHVSIAARAANPVLALGTQKATNVLVGNSRLALTTESLRPLEKLGAHALGMGAPVGVAAALAEPVPTLGADEGVGAVGDALLAFFAPSAMDRGRCSFNFRCPFCRRSRVNGERGNGIRDGEGRGGIC